jgi:hypothetical protein
MEDVNVLIQAVKDSLKAAQDTIDDIDRRQAMDKKRWNVARLIACIKGAPKD